MDHTEATKLDAVDRYLLDEFPPELRDEFEQHFFDCPECAEELRSTAAFMEAAKLELGKPARKSQGAEKRKARFNLISVPLLIASALAACLLVLVYQNVFVYPRMQKNLAELRGPEILPAVTLVGGTRRGGELPSITVANRQPFLMLVDIPDDAKYSSYECRLYGPEGALAWKIQVSSQVARDTVSISAPGWAVHGGKLTLVVVGLPDGEKEGPELLRRNFNLIVHP